MSEPQTEQRTCRFPGCTHPPEPSDGTAGRPPEYCDDPGHTRAAAWRARRRAAQDGGAAVVRDEARPVDAARQRASEIRGQVAGMVEHLSEQLRVLVAELHTVGDVDAAEAQIESVTTEAAEKVASASARATRAEQAQRKAEADRSEADAAAAEACDATEQAQIALDGAHAQLADAARAVELLAAQLADVDAQRRQAEADSERLHADLALALAHQVEVDRERDEANLQARSEAGARAQAEERARAALARAESEAARAAGALEETTQARADLAVARTERDTLRESLGELRASLAVTTSERDAARADVEHERAHGDQRVGDLLAGHDQQVTQLRAELAQVRDDAREQRSRADRAETQLQTRPTKPTTTN